MSFFRTFAEQIDNARQSQAKLDLDGARPQHGYYERKLADLQNIIANPAFSINDMPAYIDAIRNANGIGLDDRQMLLEKVLVVMSRFKEHKLSQALQEAVINLLYKDLPHPVSGYLRLPPANPPTPPENLPYVHRPSNGSHYNPLFPAMGMAGTPYARTVPSRHCLPKDSLPDPNLVFDTLLKRDDFVPHPGGMSALFFAFADLVIHSIFKTNRDDWSINDASSYLDLSVLYGHNDQDVEAVRRKDGTGRLWNDVFADSRLTHMPPASCALLVLMSRNHNYIAQKILDINEQGKFKKLSELQGEEHKKERDAQDLEIFHRTRLVNCGYFMHIILGDYVGAILGLARDRSDWRLDPMMPMRKITHEVVAVGEGNVCSIEFNLMYRWHATLSEEDTKWTEEMLKKVLEREDISNLTVEDFKSHAGKAMRNLTRENVRDWTFGGLKRGADKRFNDSQLADIIKDSIKRRAGAFKARGIPEAMRVIEVMAIKQSRSWGTCSLNEFRKFMGLKPFESFAEWNRDPKIHTAAQALYRDIDNLELHVGLQAEEAKAPMPGAGLCPGYTISRAILADAVCLVRGDRFFTSEYTPANLTSWGFQDCQYDKADGSYGGLLTKLLLRTLPDHFPRGSAFAHFPFMDPKFLQKKWDEEAPEIAAKYNWEDPNPQPTIVPVASYKSVRHIATDATAFIGGYDRRLSKATELVITKQPNMGSLRSRLSMRAGSSKRGTILQIPTGENKKLSASRDAINEVMLQSSDEIAAYFAKKTKALIKEKRFTSVDGKTDYVDIVRDVINLLPVHFISQKVAGLPLKAADSPQGSWREAIVATMFEEIAEYVYLNFAPEHDWRLREATQAHAEDIVKVIKAQIDDAKSPLGFFSDKTTFLDKVVAALNEDQSAREISAQVFAAFVPSAALFAGALSQIVNFFLQASNAEAREKVLSLCKSKEAGASAELMGYIREALRLNPVIPGFYRTAGRDVVLESENVSVKAFEVVYCSLHSANRDPTVFGPDPEVAVYNRPAEKGAILGLPQTGMTSDKFIAASIGPILGEILSLKGVQLTPNNNGRFTSFQEEWHNYPRKQYIDGCGAVSQFPDSLMVQYSTA